MEKPEKPVRVCLYARVSTQEQILDNQIIVLNDEVARHPNWTVVAQFTDKSSGANPNRPGLDAMMTAARKHEFDLILATKIDRIMRSTLNLSKICGELQTLDVGLKFVEQPFDFTTPMGKLLVSFLGAIAEWELDLIHTRTKDGQERARREGKKIGRPQNTVSKYQMDKAREILAQCPDISQRQFAD